MRKDKFIELVLLRINGGKLPDDASVLRKDIQAYLPMAVNYVVTKGLYTGIKTDNDRDLNGFFYGYYPTLPLLADNTRGGLKYFTLPKKPILLPKNQGIRSISDNCHHSYSPLSDTDYPTITHYSKRFPNQKFYYQQGLQVLVWNTTPLVNNMNITMIVDVDDLASTDELPIMAGLEAEAMDLCVQFMTGERQALGDLKSDKKDLNVS